MTDDLHLLKWIFFQSVFDLQIELKSESIRMKIEIAIFSNGLCLESELESKLKKKLNTWRESGLGFGGIGPFPFIFLN